jgi:hypothetical protein
MTARGSLVALALALTGLAGWAAHADAYVYWSDFNGTIGRANLDGTGIDGSFITGANEPEAVAVDGQRLY